MTLRDYNFVDRRRAIQRAIREETELVDLTRSPIPLYFQVASDLEHKISSGEYSPEEQLPNEKALAQKYSVSIVTIRSAMRVLFEKGMIVRYAGKGTFVASRGEVRSVWALGSLDELVATGQKSSLQLIVQRKVFPPDYVLEKLCLAPGSQVQFVRTVRETSGEPFIVADQYLPPDLSRSLKKSDFNVTAAKSRLFVQVVAERCGIRIGSVRQTMSAEAAAKDIAELLGVRAGDPLLVVERDYFSDSGRLIQAGKVHYRTDKYRYIINISQLNEIYGRKNVYHFPSDRVKFS